jgi:hypothetical protein
VAANERLAEWVDGISINLLGLEALEEPGQFELDFSSGSLPELEGRLVERFGAPEDLDDPDRRHLAEGAAGYVGEMLLRLAGGGWAWRRDEPAVRADKALGLGEVYPLRLVAQAVDERDERVFAGVYAAWEQAVARHRAADPAWRPKKKPTPGVDPFQMTEADAARVAGWVAERKAAFDRWRAAYGTGTDWDFGRGSLDVLERLLADRAPTVEALYAPEHRDFVEGAVWYLGETVRRIKGGTWVYRTQDPDVPNIYAGDPYVQQAGRDGEAVIPIVVIRGFVRAGQPGTLGAWYDRCGGTSD